MIYRSVQDFPSKFHIVQASIIGAFPNSITVVIWSHRDWDCNAGNLSLIYSHVPNVSPAILQAFKTLDLLIVCKPYLQMEKCTARFYCTSDCLLSCGLVSIFYCLPNFIQNIILIPHTSVHLQRNFAYWICACLPFVKHVTDMWRSLAVSTGLLWETRHCLGDWLQTGWSDLKLTSDWLIKVFLGIRRWDKPGDVYSPQGQLHSDVCLLQACFFQDLFVIRGNFLVLANAIVEFMILYWQT